MRNRLPFITGLVVAAALLVGACGNPVRPDLAENQPTTVASDPALEADTSPAGDQSLDTVTLIAQIEGEIVVRTTPDHGADVVVTLGSTTEFGSPRTLLVVGGEPGWVEVALPIRPNGTTGYVPADQVNLVESRHAVVIERETRTLAVFEDGEMLLQTPVAVGTADAPTPLGYFFVTDLLVTDGPDNAYGPYAFGLSGHSETLSEFAGGNGQIGIHGTNDPSSIGQAASHGCIRVPNDVVETLSQELPLGTPVHIV